jgi:hypothetical protein
VALAVQAGALTRGVAVEFNFAVGYFVDVASAMNAQSIAIDRIAGPSARLLPSHEDNNFMGAPFALNCRQRIDRRRSTSHGTRACAPGSFRAEKKKSFERAEVRRRQSDSCPTSPYAVKLFPQNENANLLRFLAQRARRKQRNISFSLVGLCALGASFDFSANFTPAFCTSR